MAEMQMAAGARPARRVDGAAVFGWTMVMAAGAVVAVNATAGASTRWWANFILVPGALLTALGVPLLARRGGAALAGYALVCVGGLVFAVGALLMAGVMGRGWPLMIVLPTLAVAGSYRWRAAHPVGRGLHRTVAGLGLTAALLGAVFLAIATGLVDFGGFHWWGGIVLLAGLVIGANGLELLRHRIEYRVSAATLLLGPAVVLVLLGLRFLGGYPPA